MVFSSLFFLYFFLPVLFFLFFIVKNPIYRDVVLILGSLSFYAWGEPVWVCILILTVMMDYLHGRIAEKYRGSWQSKAALISSLVMNLSLLGFFKYWGFFMQNLNFLLGTSFAYREFALPLGISFYTFQTLSYVIDVYKGEVAALRSPYKQLLYVSLFPQLVAGPIVRYKDIAHQINSRVITFGGFSQGISRFVTGLGKKVILANTAGEISDIFLKGSMSELSVLGAWFGIILFSLQIYFDFSGYSDMAIGLGKMFGFTYKENFNYPYVSRSAAEFWRRWHISLGSFFRDYIYIPLGGNKKAYLRNLFVVWFLTGLWHGASWNFIIWGLYYGLLILLEKLFILKLLEKIPRSISHIYLLSAVVIGWVFFYYPNLSSALEFLKVMFGLNNRVLSNAFFLINFINNGAFFIVAIIACTPASRFVRNYYTKTLVHIKFLNCLKGISLEPVVNFLILLISTMLLVGKSYNPFLYFRF